MSASIKDENIPKCCVCGVEKQIIYTEDPVVHAEFNLTYFDWFCERCFKESVESLEE